MAQPDPKPRKRVVDSKAARRKLESEPGCRTCSNTATDGHHLLLRSQGGDDVEDNIIPLCHQCHMEYHSGNIRLTARARESLYIFERMGTYTGAAYMSRRRVDWS